VQLVFFINIQYSIHVSKHSILYFFLLGLNTATVMRRLSRFRPLLAAAQVTLHVLVRRLRAVVQAGAARLTA
jgi:hypothetical protein